MCGFSARWLETRDLAMLDNGLGFMAEAVSEWLPKVEAKSLFIKPGSS
ncbi:MAG: hypothetical protein O7H41_16370 [Planctomycetota bacterium]|nr:hypothetical protein [Planctomycetota bacterium]